MDNAEDKSPNDDTPLVRRDERGKLLPGSRLAKGVKNPVAALRMQLHSAFLAAVGTQRFRDVIERHLDAIMDPATKPGDLRGLLELLYAYGLGKPLATVQLEGPEDETAHGPTVLDSEDMAALEAIRRKYQGQDRADEKGTDA